MLSHFLLSPAKHPRKWRILAWVSSSVSKLLVVAALAGENAEIAIDGAITGAVKLFLPISAGSTSLVLVVLVVVDVQTSSLLRASLNERAHLPLPHLPLKVAYRADRFPEIQRNLRASP
eukprot:RCo010812